MWCKETASIVGVNPTLSFAHSQRRKEKEQRTMRGAHGRNKTAVYRVSARFTQQIVNGMLLSAQEPSRK
jgi:hypothetical protein